MTGHFQKKSIIFRDTREHQEHDTKNRLSIPSPSSEKPVAEIDQLKKTDLRLGRFIGFTKWVLPQRNPSNKAFFCVNVIYFTKYCS